MRYTETCPVGGGKLLGVTCTSMTNGSHCLAFDATTHAFVGFVPVDHKTGTQDYQAEIIRRTGIVAKPGERP